MKLETKLKEIKGLIYSFNNQWFLSGLFILVKAITNYAVQNQLGQLSATLRQLYFLSGLFFLTDNNNGSTTASINLDLP